jgi:hypothetical protein
MIAVTAMQCLCSIPGTFLIANLSAGAGILILMGLSRLIESDLSIEVRSSHGHRGYDKACIYKLFSRLDSIHS